MTIIPLNVCRPPNYGSPLVYKDVKFMNILYHEPVGRLLQMDKEQLRHTLAGLNLLCDWLKGILALRSELEAEQKGK
jgi:hypothetical protein